MNLIFGIIMRKHLTPVLLLFFISMQNMSMAQPQKAFYIGHSLSDQIPDMVKSLSDYHPSVSFDWVYQSIPGAPLRWQWQRKENNDYGPNYPYFAGFYDEDYGLPAGNFNVLVLTESVPRHWAPWGIEETYQYADSFFVYADQFNPGTRVFLYEDWHCLQSGTPTGCDYDIDTNPWRQRLTDDLPMWESVIDTLNARFNPVNQVCLIPAAQGLARLYDSIQAGVVPDLNSIEDIFSDDIHLTDIGKYFVACIHFATIHEVSPVGLPPQLQVWWGGNFEAPSSVLALKFQEIAWQTVLEYENSCVQPILPVDLVHFKAKKVKNNSIEIEWITSAEINNKYFTIEKSFDLKTWYAIKRIESQQQLSPPPLRYKVIDSEGRQGVNYYRLRQNDFDGQYSYSPIVSVILSTENELTLYPNPVSDFLYIQGADTSQEIKIFTSAGQMVFSTGSNPVDVRNLPKGLYHLAVGDSRYNFVKE